jgi:hypothetical protein
LLVIVDNYFIDFAVFSDIIMCDVLVFFEYIIRRCFSHEDDISAEEASEIQSSWF